MAREPDDPFETPRNDELRRRQAARFDNELQPDPELAEGAAGGGRTALFAIAIIAILGVVFYGLNSPSGTQSTPTAQTTTVPVSPPPGQTTGSATSPANPSGSVRTDTTNQVAPAPSPSNGGTTSSGPPANN